MIFTVSEVIDGDTFKVEGGWELKKSGKTGKSVRPTGYDTPEEGEEGYEEAKKKLKDLIEGEEVDITEVQSVDQYGRLVAKVEYDGKELKEHFPEYKED